MVGESAALRAVMETVARVGPSSCTVLVTGESGTGKELIATAIHRASGRASGPLVPVNCGAIAPTLLETELFGHAKGAFTGAVAARRGYVGAAEGGTLFLDEIGELPLDLQVKILRLLQQREYCPVGESRTLRCSIRVVAATNRDLEADVRAGRFREDLYYRLNVIHLEVPPLRKRPEDIPRLAEHFFRLAAQSAGRGDLTGLAPEAVDALGSYEWPGNVRELENTMERAVLLAAGPRIEPLDLGERILGRVSAVRMRASPLLPADGMDFRAEVERYETSLIRQALERTNFNKQQAAKLLGINRTTLVEMVKRKRVTGGG